MDEVFAAPGAPVVGERGRVGGLFVTVSAAVAAGVLTGVAAWVVQASLMLPGLFAALAGVAWGAAVVTGSIRVWGWALAALCTAVTSGLVAFAGFAMAYPAPTTGVALASSSMLALGGQLTLGLWAWGLVSAVALRVPRERLGGFMGAYLAKWTLVLVGFQFLLPGIVFALLGALVEVSAARRDGWRRYLRDLGGNLGPAAVAVLSAALGAALAMAATLALYGFGGAVDARATPLEGHVLTSLLSGVPATLGLWLAGRIASFEADR